MSIVSRLVDMLDAERSVKIKLHPTTKLRDLFVLVFQQATCIPEYVNIGLLSIIISHDIQEGPAHSLEFDVSEVSISKIQNIQVLLL